MVSIRCINLDAFWSRASSTVAANAAQVKRRLVVSRSLSLEGPYYPPGNRPEYDHCGYEVALQMVSASLEKGGIQNCTNNGTPSGNSGLPFQIKSEPRQRPTVKCYC
jgi:hypothetical protein